MSKPISIFARSERLMVSAVFAFAFPAARMMAAESESPQPAPNRATEISLEDLVNLTVIFVSRKVMKLEDSSVVVVVII